MPTPTPRQAPSYRPRGRGIASRRVGAPGPQGLRLRDLPGLLALYDASQTCYQDSAGTTLAAVGDPVGKVPDPIGGYHATQATAGTRPTLSTLHGRPAFLFSGSHYLSADALAALVTGSSPAFTVVAVVQVVDFAATRCLLSFGRSSSATPFHAPQVTTTPVWRWQRRGDTGTSAVLDGGTPRAGTPQVVIARVAGGWGDVWLDGQLRVQGNLVPTTPTATLDRCTLGALGLNTYSQQIQALVPFFAVTSGMLAPQVGRDLAERCHDLWGAG